MNKDNMRLTTLIIFLFTSNLFGQDKEKIELCFNEFKAAFTAKDSKKSADYIDKSSVRFFKTMLKNTKNADSIFISRLEPYERLLILTTRLLASGEEIKGMNSNKLFQFYLDNNLFGSYEFIDIGDVTVEKTKGKGKIVSMGETYDFHLFFSKEKGKWKYFINSPVEVERVRLKQIMERDKITEIDFILMRVRRMTDKEVTKRTWEAIK